MRKYFFATLMTITCVSLAHASEIDSGFTFLTKDEAIQNYEDRYGLTNIDDKRVDNRGNGFEPLYGTRNFRAVLSGVVYRGGANNAYNRNGKRNNSNPLPQEGLQNLCEEGFNSSVYLYSTRYETASKSTRCSSRFGGSNVLQYSQLSPLSNDKDALVILDIVHAKLTSETDHSPIYLHCWNGWHASGYISALILRQFCDFSAEQAVAYWNRNTDGNNGSSYESIRRKIRSFRPGSHLRIDETLRTKVCPQ